MSFQIRHKEWGIFQGDFLGLGCWYPLTSANYLGLLEFETIEKAEFALSIVCSRYDRNDFTIEPFDHELDKRLINEARLTPITIQGKHINSQELPSSGGAELS